MVDVLETKYFSKADAFILPLTRLEKKEEFDMHSYLFWNENSIEDYKFIVTYSADNMDMLMDYCKRVAFVGLDKSGYLLENYDTEDRVIFVLDLSEWAKDIEMFLHGKYSKFSTEAKSLIEGFHKYNNVTIDPLIWYALYPNKSATVLNGMSAIAYVADNYGLDLEQLEKVGEIGSKYDKMAETLVTDVTGMDIAQCTKNQ